MEKLSYKLLELTTDEVEFVKKALRRIVSDSRLSLNILPDLTDSKKIEIMSDLIIALQLIDEIDSCEYKILDTSSV